MPRYLKPFVQRLGLVTLAAALMTLPAVSRAQAPSSGARLAPMPSLIGSPVLGPALGGISYSLLLALDLPPDGFTVGPRLSGEMMYGFNDLAPQLRLDLGARASFAYHSADLPAFINASGSMWLLDIVPDAKLRLAVTDQLGVYGDVGLGLALMRASVSSGGLSDSETDVSFTIQFGAGAAYAVTPNINVLGEVRFDVYTKSGTGLFVAIPTIGLEFH
jgi:opacity protein-like surface antigen